MNKETIKQILKYKILGVLIGSVWYFQGFNRCFSEGTSSICSVPFFGFLVKLPMILMAPFLGECTNDCFHYLLLIPLGGIIFIIIFTLLFNFLIKKYNSKRYGYLITITTIVYFLYMGWSVDPFSHFIFENEILHTFIAIIAPIILSYLYYLYLKGKTKLFKIILFSLIIFIFVFFLLGGYLARTTNNPDLCDIALGKAKDHCYYHIAKEKTDFNLCSKITTEKLKHNCQVMISSKTK
ncbi:MAG: hypothetical protein ABH919_01975 [bacterium]